MKSSSLNIIYYEEKEPLNVQFFILLYALMKVHQIRHAISENTESEFL